MVGKYYPLSNTYIGQWLMLIRVQSLPVSGIILAVGYLLSSGETGGLLTQDFAYLLGTVGMGHYSVYIYNDIADYEDDKKLDDRDKPLVNGWINMEAAQTAFGILGAGSMAIASIGFPFKAAVVYILCFFLGVAYNYFSNSTPYGPVFMFAWGMSATILGMVYNGGMTHQGLTVAYIFGVAMSMSIILGDVLDMKGDEESMANVFGCKVLRLGGETHFRSSLGFTLSVYSINLAMYLIMFATSLTEGAPVVAMIPLGMLVLSTWMIDSVLEKGPLIVDDRKESYMIYVIATAFTIVASLAPLIGIVYAICIPLAGIVWGLSWTKVIFGDALYFG
jgi:4-hydroxybenzoate polyprenyltransferase